MRSRARIVQAARECFAERGYRDTHMEDIAGRAGVTKRTVYNIYSDKEALFRAVIEASIAIAETFIDDLITDIEALRDPAQDLPRLAVRLAGDVLSGPVVALRRLVALESDRFPDLAAHYRARAPEAVMTALANVFADLTGRGVLDADDPRIAAEHFAFLVLGPELDRRMLGAAASPAADLEYRAMAAAHAFLRAYAPRS